MNNQPFYDPVKSYEDNYNLGPFGLFSAFPSGPLPKPPSTTFLGFNIDIPFGIPAGPLLNGKFVEAAWRWGFSLATYKTVRGNEYPCHPYPNVIRVDARNGEIHPGETVEGKLDMANIDITKAGITNSFGVPSKPVKFWQDDVRKTLTNKTLGNVLILSFMGTKKEGMTFEEYVTDFSNTCKFTKDTGADILEVNFSCPNVGKEGLICNDIETSKKILEALKSVKGNTPLLVKIGYFPNEQQQILEELLEAIHQSAEGVCGINTIQATVINKKGKQILPGSPVRLQSGICGRAIRWAGLELAERIISIKKKRNWKDLIVVGVGGVTTAEDYFRYMKLGVDAVQSATGAMWKPDLAIEVRKKLLK